MIGSPDARARISRFHAMWMGFEQAPASLLATAMKSETDQLLSRVIFQRKEPWQELLRSAETYVTYDLAKHYGIESGLPATLKPGSSAAAWVRHTNPERRGLFGHASFLQLAQTPDENKMTIRRGKEIRELLFCQDIKPPDVVTADPDMTPRTPCKADTLPYKASSCAKACHSLLDPVGLGLDRYDALGAYRDQQYLKFTDETKRHSEASKAGEAGAVLCKIDGRGDLDGKKFSGPAELAGLMLADPRMNECAAKQLYRFAMGRTEIDATDKQFLDLMVKRLGMSDFRFDQLLLDFVSSEAFAHRRAVN
jgi:hypothetical protein